MLAQVSEIKTPFHNLPVGLKFGGLVAATILLVLSGNLTAQILIFLSLILLCLSFGHAFFKNWMGNFKPLIFFVIVILIWHFWREDYKQGWVIIFRLLNAVGVANLFSMTTRLDDLLSLVTKLAQPLKYIGIEPKIISLSIALTMRFIPVLRQKSQSLNQSWKARSQKRANWRIVIPITLLALDDASQISEALRARGGIIPNEEK